MSGCAIVVEVGQAIADEINAGDNDFGLTVPAEFSYADWNLDLGVVADQQVRIDVVPVLNGYKTDFGTVGKFDHLIQFDIALRKKFGPTDRYDKDNNTSPIKTSLVNDMVLVWQRLFEFWHPEQRDGSDDSGEEMLDVPDCQWKGTDPTAIWLKQHLKQFGQYTGLIRMTFLVTRPKFK